MYPYVNKGLAQEIAENGGLVFSEFKPSAESSAFQFPMRNRLIAALSDGVLLVEAGMKAVPSAPSILRRKWESICLWFRGRFTISLQEGRMKL